MPLSATAALRKDIASRATRMEHRHFAAIAGIIATLPLDAHAYPHDEVARHFANELHATNANFDRRRFLRACGVAS